MSSSIRALACAGVFVGCIVFAADAVCQVKRPSLHRRIPHPNVGGALDYEDATFGWSMLMGDVDGSTSTDELVIASFFEDDNPGGTPVLEAGAAYTFTGNALSAHTFARIESASPQANQHLGRLYPAMGKVNATALGKSLVFLGAINTDVTYPGMGSPTTNAGIVEVYDLTTTGSSVLSLKAPQASNEPTATAPTNVHAFGHSVATGDIDGDGYQDLAVGASDSDSGFGRVYVFYGHANFLNNPVRTWYGLTSPAGAAEGFGVSVLLTDLDDDGKCELVVGAQERYITGGKGKAYVFDGQAIDALSSGALHNQSPDQTLVPPSPFDTVGGWFGWTMYDLGEMGGNSYPSGRGDIAVHAEATDWYIGASPLQTTGCGAVFVFTAWDSGETPAGGQPFLKATPATLQTPVVTVSGVDVHKPQQGARYGRGAAAVAWTDASGNDVRALLVGDPDADCQNPDDPSFPNSTPVNSSGRVIMYLAPITSSSGLAWGNNYVLLEPADSLSQGSGSSPQAELALTNTGRPQANARFGAWIVGGHYNSNLSKGQFAVCARERVLSHKAGVGQVYTFVWPQ